MKTWGESAVFRGEIRRFSPKNSIQKHLYLEFAYRFYSFVFDNLSPIKHCLPMKRLLLLCALAIPCFMACEKMDEAVSPDVEQQQDPVQSYVMRVAEEGIAMLGDAETRAVRRRIDPNRIKPCITTATRSGESDTLYYVVNFADSAGFALVAADSTSPAPLLAVTEQGNYTPGEVTNTGFDDYISLLNERNGGSYDLIIDTTAIGRYYSELVECPEIIVNPLLDVCWGQDTPYNTFCYSVITNLKSYAGCVPTAVAQIMSYHESPSVLRLTHRHKGEIDSLSLNWEQVKSHYKTDSTLIYGCWCNDHTQLSHLMREVGERLKTKYYNYLDTNGTQVISGDTYEADIIPGIRSLGYDVSSFITFSRDSVHFELNNSRPIYCHGQAAENALGHAWVIDGYHYKYAVLRTYQERPGMKPLFIREDDISTDYLHINWGWDGDCNGYYQTGVFTCIKNDGTPRSFNYNVNLLTIKPVE